MATILAVEDESEMLSFLTEALTPAGHDVIGVGTVDAAREVLGQYRDKINLVILDIWLPGANGFELLGPDEIIPTLDIRVLVISGGSSGYPIEKTIAQSDILGAHEFLIKPFTPAELLAAVEKVLS